MGMEESHTEVSGGATVSSVNLIHGDCLIETKQIPDGSVDLVFVDPPYNIGKAEWDKIDNYLEWCAEWIAECSRVLKPNGAFWISHSKPLVLAQLSGLIKGRGLRNWITWDKYNQKHELMGYLDGHTLVGSLRSWKAMAEYLIYHADEGEWTSQCDKERGFIFEPLRAYLSHERQMAGRPFGWFDDCIGTNGLSKKYFNSAQWQLPTKETYNIYQSTGRFKRGYEDLRAEFENLRYTFNNPGKMSSVWQIPPARPNFHVTPKPEELMRRIIEATSNEGDIVLDPMMGSGTTGVACVNLKREFIGIEMDEKYFKLAQGRIREAGAQTTMDLREELDDE